MFSLSLFRKGVKKNYEIDKKELGKGQFATVRRGVHRKSGQVVKFIDPQTCEVVLF
jgi:hypothetical protein